MGALRHALGAVLLVAVSTAAALAIGEAALRLLDARRGTRDPSLLDELTWLAHEAGVAEDGFNVYYLGGSTMVGQPYDPRMSIPKLVEVLFGGRLRGRSIHSVNLAGKGVDLRFNADRLDVVLAHPEIFHPSLVVAQSGHNEFLKFMLPFVWTWLPVDSAALRHALGSIGIELRALIEPESASSVSRWLSGSHLLAQMSDRLAASELDLHRRSLFDVPCAGPETRDRVRVLYEKRFAHLVDEATQHDVAVVLMTEASNMSDFQPSRSVYQGPPERRKEFERLLLQTVALEQSGHESEALTEGRRALELDPSFAELQFWMGRIYERRGERNAAHDAYQAALDNDAMPLRTTSQMNAAIRRIGREKGVPVADVVAEIALRSERPAPGYDWFVDSAHPNVAGYVVMARVLADTIRARFAPDFKIPEFDAAAAVARFALDQRDFHSNQALDRGQWFVRIATLRFDMADRLSRAERAFEEAEELESGRVEPHLGLAMVAFLRHDSTTGDRELAYARGLKPARTEEYFAWSWVQGVVADGHRVGDRGGLYPVIAPDPPEKP